jgi:DNA-nicking Smr family endonuclease
VKRSLRPEEARLWAKVASSVQAAPGRTAVQTAASPTDEPAAAPARSRSRHPKPPVHALHHQHHRLGAPDPIEPRRLRRLARERESLGPRIDLHGMGQDEARTALAAFIDQASHEGWRAVLVITGKGPLGEGVLRRRLPDWLAEPPIRGLIAGVSEAHRRHGGKGALYLTLRRRLT